MLIVEDSLYPWPGGGLPHIEKVNNGCIATLACPREAMISDLLTIRADRDNYYYGCRLLTINFRTLLSKV